MSDKNLASSGKAKTNYSYLCSFLTAVSFFLSTIEYMLPRPVPFMRIGLANLPLLIAVKLLPFKYYMLLALLKVLGMALLSGSLFSYIVLFSFAGTICSALLMRLLSKLCKKNISYVGLCIAGALCSNVVQVIFAKYTFFGDSAFFMLPGFLALALGSGLVLGIFTNKFTEKSKWFFEVSKCS